MIWHTAQSKPFSPRSYLVYSSPIRWRWFDFLLFLLNSQCSIIILCLFITINYKIEAYSWLAIEINLISCFLTFGQEIAKILYFKVQPRLVNWNNITKLYKIFCLNLIGSIQQDFKVVKTFFVVLIWLVDGLFCIKIDLCIQDHFECDDNSSAFHLWKPCKLFNLNRILKFIYFDFLCLFVGPSPTGIKMPCTFFSGFICAFTSN